MVEITPGIVLVVPSPVRPRNSPKTEDERRRTRGANGFSKHLHQFFDAGSNQLTVLVNLLHSAESWVFGTLTGSHGSHHTWFMSSARGCPKNVILHPLPCTPSPSLSREGRLRRTPTTKFARKIFRGTSLGQTPVTAERRMPGAGPGLVPSGFASRWGALCITACFAAVVVATTSAAEGLLPVGPAPEPIAIDHFPDRFHAFVWRNWNLVPPEKLAAVAETPLSNVVQCAASMGLPQSRSDPSGEFLRRGYITLLRRNWHLLPYDQLLRLVEMTEEELRDTLREDDFLWVKFGRLKPKCAPLRFVQPTDAVQARAAEIRRVVESNFAEFSQQPGEASFQFVREMSETSPGVVRRDQAAAEAALLELRFIYSYFGLYGDPLLHPELDPYPDGLLQRLASVDVNGVWLHVVLRQLAPGGELFPDGEAERAIRLANLQRLVDRAAHFGIGIYLYLNEPRAMPEAFFQNRPDLRGVQEGEHVALCTSAPDVQRWLEESVAFLFRNVRGLAGAFTITASENLTNCASHGREQDCKRCARRSADEIIAEVNSILARGIWSAAPDAKVIFWDWGWHGHGEAPELIERLPREGWLMSVSEWGVPIERGGIRSTVGEYSISAVGPGPRASQEWLWARQRGLKTAAKVQLNNSWELSSLPYLPVEALVAEHCQRLAQSGVDGMMLSWTLGGYPSPNLEVAAQFSRAPTPTVDEVLQNLALDRFGPKGAPFARKAWTAFAAAFQAYPFHGSVVYRAPVQYGPANLLHPAPTGYRSTMTGMPYDDLDGWRGPYPPEVFAAQFDKITQGWQPGVDLLRRAVDAAPADKRAAAESELRYAMAAGTYFQSVGNQIRFILRRDRLAQPDRSSSAEQEHEHTAAIRQILQDEIRLAKELYRLARVDSRIGFEAANQYFYVPNDLIEKVVNCQFLLDRLSSAR